MDLTNNVISHKSQNPPAVTYLQVLLVDRGHQIAVDGNFGFGTELAVKRFQQLYGLEADGIVGPKTWAHLIPVDPKTLRLSPSDVDRAAEDLQVDRATIEAVCDVEASGSGFIGIKPKILFEGHVFWRRLKKHGLDPLKHRYGNEDILYETWTTRHYLKGIFEYQRLYRARKIHDEAALESSSWGLFQIMGLNYLSAGESNVIDFVEGMKASEAVHLRAFCNYVRNVIYQGNPLANYLKEKDWPSFARAYNGPDYSKNHYDKRLAVAYAKRR